MATSTFNKEFKLKNTKEANSFADAMSASVSPTIKKGFNSSMKSEKEVRKQLEKALK